MRKMTTALRRAGTKEETVPASQLHKGDIVIIEAGMFIPGDGEVIEGVASVDESAITGESAPVIRESGGDRSAVTGGTKVLSDRIVVRITANSGESFLDRMISLVEGAARQKTPEKYRLRGRDVRQIGATFIPFSAQTRMSGCDLNGRVIRKGAVDAVRAHVKSLGGHVPEGLDAIAHSIGDKGGTPLAVSDGDKVLGIIHISSSIWYVLPTLAANPR
jgi:high-affinity K+ transport system ATPase subunit B